MTSEHLGEARVALQRSAEAGADSEELRELRVAVDSLILAIQAPLSPAEEILRIVRHIAGIVAPEIGETIGKIPLQLIYDARAALAASVEPKPTDEQHARALDAAFEAKGRELSYTEEAWLNAALVAALSEGPEEGR